MIVLTPAEEAEDTERLFRILNRVFSMGKPVWYDDLEPDWESFESKYEGLTEVFDLPPMQHCWGISRLYGRPQMRYGGKTQFAYRIAYQVLIEPLTPPLHVAHVCQRGEDGCINFTHLIQCTASENQYHAARKKAALKLKTIAGIELHLEGVRRNPTNRRLGVTTDLVLLVLETDVARTGLSSLDVATILANGLLCNVIDIHETVRSHLSNLKRQGKVINPSRSMWKVNPDTSFQK